jgi:hypothetical protein
VVIAVVKTDEIEAILEDLEHAAVGGTRRDSLPESDGSAAAASADASVPALPPCPEGA